MQEPQYRSPGVRELLNAVAKARVPCMSIMNMPPLPYLKRIPGLATDALRSCYTDATVWEEFDPAIDDFVQPGPAGLSAAGRKDQRAASHLADQLQGGALRSERIHGHAAPDGSGYRSHPLRLATAPRSSCRSSSRCTISIFVPLAKWAMLLTGNYRCVQKDAARSIKDAVHPDIEASRAVYNWVCELCIKLGASPERPRALREICQRGAGAGAAVLGRARTFAGAPNIERVDRLVQSIAAQKGMRNPVVDETVALVDARLASIEGSRLIARAFAESGLPTPADRFNPRLQLGDRVGAARRAAVAGPSRGRELVKRSDLRRTATPPLNAAARLNIS